jgi:hypothetical protein
MKRIRALFKRVGGGRRPPTGPLTTAEAIDAEQLRLKTLANDSPGIEREQAKRDVEAGSDSE